MIQPICCINYSNKTSFKGFYDPACVSIPASMRETAVNKVKECIAEGIETPAVKASLEEFKANFMPGLSEKANEAVSEAANKSSVLTHLLYDSPYSIDIPVNEVVEKTTILDSANILSPQFTGSEASAESGILNNLLEQTDSLTDISDAGDTIAAIGSSAGELAEEAAGTVLEKLSEHTDDIQDLIDLLG